jgi:hypothetical protein
MATTNRKPEVSMNGMETETQMRARIARIEAEIQQRQAWKYAPSGPRYYGVSTGYNGATTGNR